MTEHITPVRTYVLVAVALVALTLATVGVSYLPLGALHGPAALIFATVKAFLVIFYFMHARRSGPLTRIVIVVSLFWLGVLIVGTLDDYLTRSWLATPGH